MCPNMVQLGGQPALTGAPQGGPSEMGSRSRLGRLDDGRLEDYDLPVRLEGERRRIVTEQLALPPDALLALGLHVREPVAINDGANLGGRRGGKGIRAEK